MDSKAMGKYILYTQYPKPKKIGIGVLCVGEDGDARFWSGNAENNDTILAVLI